MREDVKAKWLEALRSGEYKQGREALRTVDNAYCCLGVLCDIVGVEWTFGARGAYGHYGDTQKVAHPDKRVYEACGLDDSHEGTLVEMNDDAGKTFAEIADWIEVNL
jgi:hypothetical protein